MIKVSIVVPVYNVEKYLEKCLNSLVHQTLQEIEIIVVNDGTKDNSQQIIDQFVMNYPDKVISLIKPNGGLSDARNYGMPYCKGQFIGFVDSDDYVELDMYEKMYQEAILKNCEMVVCDYIKEYTCQKEVVKARQYTSSKDMFIGGLAAAWNKIYSRELLERTGILFPKGLIYEDTEFFCKLIPHVKKCGYVAEPLLHYVQREGSIANSQGSKVAMIFDIFQNILSYYKENKWYDHYKDELEFFVARVLLGSSMERICRCNDANVRKDLLYGTIDFLDANLKGWKNNCYLADWKSKRNLYMKFVSRWNVVLLANCMRFYFIQKDKKLM